jgi:predicted nucleic acid-binding protein
VIVVVDTSVLIDHLRDVSGATEALDRAFLSGEHVAGSVLTRSEILAGQRPGEEWNTERLLTLMDWIPVSLQVADRAGILARGFRRSYPGVDLTDYVVAATADVTGGKLWTLNVKHFPMFPGLTRPY